MRRARASEPRPLPPPSAAAASGAGPSHDMWQALREREARYHSVFETSRDAICITEPDGRFIDFNDSLLKMFGYTREELSGLNARVLYADPSDRLRFKFELEKNRTVCDFEVRLRRRDGSVLDCLVSSSIWQGTDATKVSYHGIIRDVTEQKRAHAALQTSEHFTRTIIASVGEGIIVYDGELRYQVWNQFMEKLTGLSASEVLGQPALQSFPHLRGNGIDRLLQRALAGETVQSPDMPYHIPQTGRAGWVAGLYSPHVAPDGEIIGVVAILHDVTDRKRAEEMLLHNAFHDALTDLPNRSLFLDRLERVTTHAKRHPTDIFAVLFLDIDRFKIINDSLGHLVGDHLLVTIARRLETCVRDEDTVARLGGDEFAILLTEVADVSDATRVAKRVQHELAKPLTLDGHEVYVSASVGIALSSSGYDRPEDVLRDADTAMYRAKTGGRARYEVFDRAMHREAVGLLQLESDLRRALERNEFVLHYQPIISLETGELTGFEALVRWSHPTRGLLQPGDFIELAEETGAIVPLGWWVVGEACRQIMQWTATSPRAAQLNMSVNFSARQFSQPDLIERIDQILQRTGFDPGRLRLEITEYVMMQSATTASTMLDDLRRRGIQLCIDDFGTGYSSLSYLHRFPIDTLKIDRSFISRVDEEGSSLQLIETIVALSRTLGLEAIAEGVETPEQLEMVRRLGSGFAQGYQISMPLPAADAEALIRGGKRW
ncbi:MAG TPA: EAL domain-containing protein [Longimicrobiales bacterium]|nr:EAL domain-containing protein [Longimicrobiales bacterium]